MFSRQPSPEEQASKELAASFQDIQKFYAWKFLMGELVRMKSKAVDDIDKIPIDELTVQRIARARGIRECINDIMRKIDYAKEGLWP